MLYYATCFLYSVICTVECNLSLHIIPVHSLALNSINILYVMFVKGVLIKTMYGLFSGVYCLVTGGFLPLLLLSTSAPQTQVQCYQILRKLLAHYPKPGAHGGLAGFSRKTRSHIGVCRGADLCYYRSKGSGIGYKGNNHTSDVNDTESGDTHSRGGS